MPTAAITLKNNATKALRQIANYSLSTSITDQQIRFPEYCPEGKIPDPGASPSPDLESR